MGKDKDGKGWGNFHHLVLQIVILSVVFGGSIHIGAQIAKTIWEPIPSPNTMEITYADDQ